MPIKRLLIFLLFASSAHATTYYVAASGADTNNGTTKTTPWLHAPGMNGCVSVCASTNPAAGDSVIFRGGDTWTVSTTAWQWNWAGSATNCNLNAAAGAVVKTSCVYVGVDLTWFSGASWTRPKMNGGNAPSTSYISSCPTTDFSSKNLMFITQPYVIFDNIEWKGICWATLAASGGYITEGSGASHNQISNMYFHGWTTGTTTQDQFRMITCNSTGCSNGSYIRCDHNVFDGSDSTEGTTAGHATGFALGGCYDIDHNVFWHVSNGYIGGSAVRIHDNLQYYVIEPNDRQDTPSLATHGNNFEMQGSNTCSTYFYNNLQFATGEGEGNNLYTASGCPLYVFNNISWAYRAVFTGSTYSNGSDGSNCFLPENTGGSGPRVWQVFNNTLDSPCAFSQKNISLTQVAQNNQLIGFTALSQLMGATITDNGNELFQTEAAANAQGYTIANAYAPTTGGATIAAGANLSSLCGAMPDTVAAAACLKGYGGVTYNQLTHTAVDNTPITRPVGTPWDIGAYQLPSGVAVPPAPGTTIFGAAMLTVKKKATP